ncbi:MAG: beta-propeller domain-containing protein [Clostridia bacterium]|nr:beta-propeller domain-containing protein [Clostridia bacterium]
MKTNKQRIDGVKEKLQKKQRARKRNLALAFGCIGAACLTALNLVLFTPYPTVEREDVAVKYRQSEYCSLITKLDKVTYQPERIKTYKNNFDKWIGSKIKGIAFGCGGKAMENDAMLYGTAVNELAKDTSYIETTDNQTAGVIEGDLLKRTQSHIFYLSQTNDGGYLLRAYDINGLDSQKIAQYEILPKDGTGFYGESAELYLSEDGAQATAVLQSYQKAEGSWQRPYVTFIGLDVSNLPEITETGRTHLSGSYISTRKVDGQFLAMSEFSVRYNPNFDNPAEFLPQYGAYGQMQSVAAEDIYAPETLTVADYTLVCTLDEKTLQTQDSAAFLSYSQETYISQENLYFTRSYSDKEERGNDEYALLSKTEISRLSYADGTLEYKGAFTLNGHLKNRYSLDEYNGVLRAVTTCNESRYKETKTGEYTSRKYLFTNRPSVNLYCVKVEDYSLLASVEDFAPEGERAESVRFDKDKAYICTAIVVTLTDPVFVFDLSDLTNITYKDTGEIDGYSSSLISFGNGYLVGIGYDRERNLKIEVYKETADGVVSVDSYVDNVEFSEEYKSYFIDRENGYIGLGVEGKKSVGEYRLLAFDGHKLYLKRTLVLWGANAQKRGVVIDGFLYAFGEKEDEFAVGKI